MATINSVLGEIDSKDLGFTLMHEHHGRRQRVVDPLSGLASPFFENNGPSNV